MILVIRSRPENPKFDWGGGSDFFLRKTPVETWNLRPSTKVETKSFNSKEKQCVWRLFHTKASFTPDPRNPRLNFQKTQQTMSGKGVNNLSFLTPSSHRTQSTSQEAYANNGTHCDQWECSHSLQTTSKVLHANLGANVLTCPVSTGHRQTRFWKKEKHIASHLRVRHWCNFICRDFLFRCSTQIDLTRQIWSETYKKPQSRLHYASWAQPQWHRRRQPQSTDMCVMETYKNSNHRIKPIWAKKKTKKNGKKPRKAGAFFFKFETRAPREKNIPAVSFAELKKKTRLCFFSFSFLFLFLFFFCL